MFDRAAHVLPREDPDAAAVVQRRLVKDSVDLELGVKLIEAVDDGGEVCLRFERPDGAGIAEARGDRLLVAAGRAPNIEGLGLDAAGVSVSWPGVTVNDQLRTSNRRVYAVGDVCSAFQFTHAADAMARLVIQNALFYGRRRASALVIPWCTYTDPEVAHVGLYEQEARQRGHEVQTITVELTDVDRAVIDDDTDGFVRVHHERGRLLGCTIVASHAGELIGEATFALTHRHTLSDLSSTIHPLPDTDRSVAEGGRPVSPSAVDATCPCTDGKVFSMDPLMPLVLDDATMLRAPAYATTRLSGASLALDPATPNWIATDDRGMRLLPLFDGKTPMREVVSTYAADADLDVAKAWLHVETFARDALRQGFLSSDGAVSPAYLGRSAYLRTDRLAELWLHVNDFCNLSCAHCLVSSGPDRSQGLPTERLVDAIDQGVALGVERFFFTGGEPLARPDALELSRRIVTDHQRELVILTNGTLFRGERLDELTALAGDRLRVQISLDGASAETNDPIRGAGSFARITAGIRTAVAAGLRPSVTMVLLQRTLGDVDALVRFAATLGVRNVHLLWPHRRGRVLNGPFANLPGADAILGAVRGARAVARELGVSIDNVDEFRLRMDGRAGRQERPVRRRLEQPLCVYGRLRLSVGVNGRRP